MKKWISKHGPKAKDVASFSIIIPVGPEHPMARLNQVLPWESLLEIASRHRKLKCLRLVGRKPHLREMLGATVVRIVESCTLRKASDLMAHYAPARLLCGLQDSGWTPNFRTLSDFEILLGADGLSEINAVVLRAARQQGFLDVRGLCSDTTAQEARIPYPNEVGLMKSFADSVGRGLALLKGRIKTGRRGILKILKKIKKQVRTHRLFAKTSERKRKVETELLHLTRKLQKGLSAALEQASASKDRLTDQDLKSFLRLQKLQPVMQKLLPQIQYYISKGKVAKDKVVSLFLPEVRSIVRGKVGKTVEFGLKWGINQIRGGYISLYLLQGKAGEADWALEGIIHHQELFGLSPIEFGYDRGGWSEAHLEQIKKEGVKRVAVAPRGKAKWKVSRACRKRIIPERAQVEGKIGTIKRYGFNKPDAKTQHGMYRSARRSELRFNLTRFLKDLAVNQASVSAA